MTTSYGQRKQKLIDDQNISTDTTFSSGRISGLVTNPNILHNWDFRNPVNQRGLLEYVNGGYAIDRWLKRTPGVNMKLTANGIRIEHLSNTQTRLLEQFIENPNVYAGMTVTLSALCNAIINNALLIVRVNNVATGLIDVREGLISTTITLPENITTLAVEFISRAGQFAEFTIAAVKLELGTASTLANDPPMDFGRELAVCQRFQLVLNQRNDTWCVFGTARIATPTSADVFIPIPTTMRVNPQVIIHPIVNLAIARVTGFGHFPITLIRNIRITESMLFATVEGSFGSIPLETTCAIASSGGTEVQRIMLDANL